MTFDPISDESETTEPSILITAAVVPDEQRMAFMPRMFGRHFMSGEALVYQWMDLLAPAYNGGFWTFYVLSNGGFYMAPDLDCETLRIQGTGNGYDGTMSPDAAGLVATLYAINALVWKTCDSVLIDRYDRLRDYAGDHAEGPEIFAAID